jgi:SAM-dependent methyltransferase
LLRCPYCEHELSHQREDDTYLCTNCSISFRYEDGIYNFLSKESEIQEFFPEESFDLLFRLEKNSFWFSGRNLLIKNIISNYLPLDSTILEVGCGTGFVSSFLRSIGYNSLDCSDVFLAAVRYCKQRRGGCAYYLFDLTCSPFFEHYDAICVFDVLEHINDDELALQNAYNSVRAGGSLFITVPASGLLWSEVDVYSKHKRRYSRKELIQKVERAGFHVLRCSYFMSLLFPLLLARRRMRGRAGKEIAKPNGTIGCFGADELRLNPLLNIIFLSIFALELLFLKYGNLPFGSSLFCVAQKTTTFDF